ncbi:MAG: hypothetical protein AAF489_07005 [Bacteroidota bacterium]
MVLLRITIVALLVSFSAQSQIRVYLKNGEVKEGSIGLFKQKAFKLKQTKKGKAEKFKAKNTDSIVLINQNKREVYHSIDSGFYRLCERGAVDIYVSEGTTVSGYGSFSYTYYLLKRPADSEFMDFSNNWKWFYKIVESYFPDCPKLIEKVKNEEEGFKRKNILEIGKYYNSNCGY